MEWIKFKSLNKYIDTISYIMIVNANVTLSHRFHSFVAYIRCIWTIAKKTHIQLLLFIQTSLCQFFMIARPLISTWTIWCCFCFVFATLAYTHIENHFAKNNQFFATKKKPNTKFKKVETAKIARPTHKRQVSYCWTQICTGKLVYCRNKLNGSMNSHKCRRIRNSRCEHTRDRGG